MNAWLSSFEYRIRISPDVFLMEGGISFNISLMTISYQIWKTAISTSRNAEVGVIKASQLLLSGRDARS